VSKLCVTLTKATPCRRNLSRERAAESVDRVDRDYATLPTLVEWSKNQRSVVAPVNPPRRFMDTAQPAPRWLATAAAHASRCARCC
jgi:hypothetical protein